MENHLLTPDTQDVTVRMTHEHIEALEAMAEAKEVSFAEMVWRAINEYLHFT